MQKYIRGSCVSRSFHYTLSPPLILGGNQRELARAKNAKKQAGKAKGASDQAGNKGAGLEKRKERDADIMREKQKKAAEKKGS